MIDLGGKPTDPAEPGGGPPGAPPAPPTGEPPAGPTSPPAPASPVGGPETPGLEPTLKDIMKILKRIEEALARIEAKSGG